MEKEPQPDSMTTIAMKPEYPPSEYSASEPPPAYRQRASSSVQIARIVALTVVASSFILGSFILASSWVQARASCHQLEQLDAMLDKELALESRAYGNDGLLPEELPSANAHALHGTAPPQEPMQPQTSDVTHSPPSSGNQVKEDGLSRAESKIDEDKLQKLDGDSKKPGSSESDDSSESDSSSEDEDELDAMRPLLNVPLQLDLDEIAGAFLANSQKGRMNCVVEKRNEEPMERRFPFNLLAPFAPRASAPTAERIAIICHGGDDPRGMESFPDPQSQVFAFPLSGPVRLPVRPQPQRGPVSLPFPDFTVQRQGTPFNMPMPWDSSEEQQGANAGAPPREMRIHVQRVIAVPAPHNMPPQDMGAFAPPPPPQQQQEQNEQSSVVHQFVPQPAPTQEMELPEGQRIQMQPGLPWGLTPELIQMIHRDAEESAASQRREQQQQQIDNDMQEVKTIVNTLVTAAAESEEEPATQAQPVSPARAPRTVMIPHEADPALVNGRPHYVHPRSVRTARSVDAMLDSQKRVKRCSCACK